LTFPRMVCKPVSHLRAKNHDFCLEVLTTTEEGKK
jgi:hypothetical protein